MADRRVPDLSYGHLGDAFYDIDEGEWEFSVNTSQSQIFEQITAFKRCLPAEAQIIPKTINPRPLFAQSQMKWIIKTRPEIFPANAIASAFTKTSSAAQTHYTPLYGQLLAVGSAVDAGHQPEYRTYPIIVIPCGEAGHVLRLIRLQAESQTWRKQSAAKLALSHAASGDVGHWGGIGGTLRQITFADEGSVSSSFLATRQDSMVTIFRPMYHKQPVRTVIPGGYDKQYPPSRLSANPVAVLTAEVCGSRRHVDTSFNPFYARQFGVVDDSGRWSIWDIEGPVRMGTTLELSPGKNGGVYDDFVPNPREKTLITTDGWHRILWAVNGSTIVVCNRCHVAVFDVEATPTRLPNSESLSTRANDWILDIKRSPMRPNHLFVLTTSRVFLVEVIPSGAGKDGQDAGIRVIQSYRHFRAVSDETMNLTVLKEDDVSVLVSSSKSLLVSFYKFSMASGHTDTPTSSQGSFEFSTSLDNQGPSHEMLRTTHFVPALLTSNSNWAPGPELQLVERNVQFYQVWALTSNFELRSTLCAMYTMPSRTGQTRLRIMAPTTRIPIRRHLSESAVAVLDSFVVRDNLATEEGLDYAASTNQSQAYRHHQELENAQGDLKPRLNWRCIFQRVYMDDFLRGPPNYSLARSSENMSQLVNTISHRIAQMTETDTVPMTSLLELSRVSDFSGDLQQSAPILDDLLKMLQESQNVQEAFDLILSDLTLRPRIGLAALEGSKLSGLLKVYDQVGDHWIASLPLKASNLARLSKFKIARKVAVELCLSSIAVSIRKRPQTRETLSTGGGIDLPLYEEPHDSQSLTSQVATSLLPEIRLSLPTPSRTPSVYSHMSNDTSEPGEDPSTTRLRQYAVSIRSLPDLGESALLSQWPSVPGVDPGRYSWRSNADEGVDQVDSRKHREEARRRRRVEKFLDRERMKESQGSSQPIVIRSGSQPELGQPATSSQSVTEVSMTQPDRGAFGTRSTKPGKKKQGKRRAAGF